LAKTEFQKEVYNWKPPKRLPIIRERIFSNYKASDHKYYYGLNLKCVRLMLKYGYVPRYKNHSLDKSLPKALRRKMPGSPEWKEDRANK